jgi:hypothetical protein
MNAATDIQSKAQLFGWTCHQEHNHTTCIHGQHMIAIDTTRAGTIADAKRYEFHRITHPELRECATGRNKRATVVSWLVGYGS